jgi:hypothetical protein
MTYRTGQEEQDHHDRTIRTGMPVCQFRSRAGQPGQNSLDQTASTGQPGQDRAFRKGQSEEFLLLYRDQFSALVKFSEISRESRFSKFLRKLSVASTLLEGGL